jgi:hypothetical protein
MRSLFSGLLAFLLSASALLLTQGGVADASFHCMRIHAVASGFNGNDNIQFVELRMDLVGQTQLAAHTLQFFDASGVLKATFTFPAGNFPLGASVANGTSGDSILLGTSEFNANVSGGASDFTFNNANTTVANGGDPLHPVQQVGGYVVWAGTNSACATIMAPVDSVAYGGATASYGTAAVALPHPDLNQALRLSNLNNAPSNNSTEYSLMNIATSTFAVAPGNVATDFTTPRNNSRTVLKLNAPPASVGGVADAPAPAPASAVSGQSSGTSWHWQILAAGIAAAVCTSGAAWYAYRRRIS